MVKLPRKEAESPSPEVFKNTCRCGTLGHGLVWDLAVPGYRLDLMIFKVFFNLMILSAEAHSVYLEHTTSLERFQTRMQSTLLRYWTLTIPVELKHLPVLPPQHVHISRFPHPISSEAANPKDMGAGRNGRTQQRQSTKQFMARLYLPWIQTYQPQGL